MAPEQIAQVRPPGGAWKAVNRDTLDTGRAYRFVHGDGSGRSINLAIFDGPLSRELAFGTATRDSESFLATIKACGERSSATGRRLVLAASDGELYGHHKKFSDLMLAHALTSGATKAGINVTNLGAFFRDDPPTWEAELAKGPLGEGTAWSCAHGLGRWLRHCGCAMRSPDESGWSQAWRTPLRGALDYLRDRAADLFEQVGAELFDDPWAVRDAYGAVLDAPPEVRGRFLAGHGRAPLKRGKAGATEQALVLMELSRATLLMYASCGWFFDDVAGIESALVTRQAAYVLDLWKRFSPRPPTKEVLARLAEARSNIPHAGTGADVFHRVARHRTTGAEVAATFAFAELAHAVENPGGLAQIPGYSVTPSKASRNDNGHGGGAKVKGQLTARNNRTGEAEVVTLRGHAKNAAGTGGRGRSQDRADPGARAFHPGPAARRAARPGRLRAGAAVDPGVPGRGQGLPTSHRAGPLGRRRRQSGRPAVSRAAGDVAVALAGPGRSRIGQGRDPGGDPRAAGRLARSQATGTRTSGPGMDLDRAR